VIKDAYDCSDSSEVALVHDGSILKELPALVVPFWQLSRVLVIAVDSATSIIVVFP
jgi:hypothetical protein